MYVNTPGMSDSPSMGPSSLESMSDSEDWMEIVESFESDGFSESTHSKSRRSSISIPSDSEGHIDTWEGLVDALTDDASPSTREATPAPEDAQSDAEVKAALDQSFVGTLNTSRSTSTTQSSSNRDLRLSFPDPLSSSFTTPDVLGTFRPHTNNRARALTPQFTTCSDSQTSSSQATSPPESAVLVQNPDAPSADEQDVDSGVGATTPESSIPEDTTLQPRVLFEIFLYGSPSPVRWSAVGNLLRKTNFGPGRGIISVSHNTESHTRIWHIEVVGDHVFSIPVYDRTALSSVDLSPHDTLEYPSLAFVCLPFSSSNTIREHEFYLPVIVNLDQESDHEQHSLLTEWQVLNIPSSRQLLLPCNRDDGIVTDEELAQLANTPVDEAMQPLLEDSLGRALLPAPSGPSPTHAKDPIREINSQLVGVISLSMAVMLAACFLSLILGSETIPTRTVEHKGTWTVIHSAEPFSKVVVTETALPSPSSKDYIGTALSHRVQTAEVSASLYSTIKASSLGRPPQVSKVTAIMVRPPTSLAVSTHENAEAGPSRGASTAPLVSPATTKALSYKFVDSVSKIYDFDVQGFIQSVHDDFQELNEVLDGLMSEISDVVLHGPRAVAENVGEELQYRHNRAKGRAKDLIAQGERWVVQTAPKASRCAREPWLNLQQQFVNGNARAHGRAKRIRMETSKWLGHAWSHDKDSE